MESVDRSIAASSARNSSLAASTQCTSSTMNTVLARRAFIAELISSISMCRRAAVFFVGIGIAASPIAMTSNKTAISSEPGSARSPS